MKNRSPIAVLLLPFITFGIYSLVWSVKTKNEMNALGASIPTAWLLIIPFVNLYWMWKYAQGVQHVTKGGLSQVAAFLLLLFLSVIGMAIGTARIQQAQRRPRCDAGDRLTLVTQPADRAARRPVRRAFSFVQLAAAPQHFLYFRPLPHGQGSLRPTFGASRR